VAERAPPGVQPGDEPQPGRRVRRTDRPPGARRTRAARLDAARERPGQPRRQVPAPLRRSARPRWARALAPRGADAARAADAGRAEAAKRAPLPVRGPRGDRTRPLGT